jgi:hypothetical protein
MPIILSLARLEDGDDNEEKEEEDQHTIEEDD